MSYRLGRLLVICGAFFSIYLQLFDGGDVFVLLIIILKIDYNVSVITKMSSTSQKNQVTPFRKRFICVLK